VLYQLHCLHVTHVNGLSLQVYHMSIAHLILL